MDSNNRQVTKSAAEAIPPRTLGDFEICSLSLMIPPAPHEKRLGSLGERVVILWNVDCALT